MGAAKADLEAYGNTVRLHPTEPNYIAVFGDDDSGAINSIDYEEEEDLNWNEWAALHLCEGQVLVLKEAGAEKQRYVSGWSAAYTWDGRSVHLNLNDIFKKLQSELGIDPDTVADPSYTEFK